MSVADRWHKTYPKPGDVACKEHSRGRHKLYPTSEHLQGDRWQVRWYDLNETQRSRNFALREGSNPEIHADAFDAKITAELNAGTYVDPKLAEGTFGAYALERVAAGTGNATTRRKNLGMLRNHVLEDPATPGRTPAGGTALGHRTFVELQQRVSYTRDWMKDLTLAPQSALQVVRLVSSVFMAAMDDGLIRRNPTVADSVKGDRPKAAPKKAQPWAPEVVCAVADGLRAQEPRYEIIPYLGAATGQRQGEMFGLAAEDIGDPAFFRRKLLVQVCRQVKVVGSELCYGPVKNRKEHWVPVPPEFAEMLLAYMEQFPPAEVTLRWDDEKDRERHGKMMTFRLIVARPGGKPVNRNVFNDYSWKPALGHAGLIPPRERGDRWARARELGCHRLRHTAVSQWLTEGASAADVAEWIGDTPAQVYATYAHMMPGAEEKGRRGMAKFFSRINTGARFVPSGEHSEAKPQVTAISGDFRKI